MGEKNKMQLALKVTEKPQEKQKTTEITHLQAEFWRQILKNANIETENERRDLMEFQRVLEEVVVDH